MSKAFEGAEDRSKDIALGQKLWQGHQAVTDPRGSSTMVVWLCSVVLKSIPGNLAQNLSFAPGTNSAGHLHHSTNLCVFEWLWILLSVTKTLFHTNVAYKAKSDEFSYWK